MIAIEQIVVEPPADGETVSPMAWFDSPGPFEIEIGCGKGGFLLSRAKANPEVRILGIEWANKYFRSCADRMARWEQRNVRVMRTDAKHFVMHHLPPACVSALHIYHPDPWPKKRHHKRRLFQPESVDAFVRLLLPDGRLLVQSDHSEYFSEIRRLLDGHAALDPIDWQEADCAAGADFAGTNFEVKYARDGAPIHRAAYARRNPKSDVP